MTALKAFRVDLGEHLAKGLGVTHAKFGAQANPPAVQVTSGAPYVTASDYCTDSVTFLATVVTSPGDPEAVADLLDDTIDKVRSTLRQPSTAGHRYSFREVSGVIEIDIGGTPHPGVVVTVVMERKAP